eukprot:scaffold113016_cov18-Tisochrysis_lutea.AAC.1
MARWQLPRPQSTSSMQAHPYSEHACNCPPKKSYTFEAISDRQALDLSTCTLVTSNSGAALFKAIIKPQAAAAQAQWPCGRSRRRQQAKSTAGWTVLVLQRGRAQGAGGAGMIQPQTPCLRAPAIVEQDEDACSTARTVHQKKLKDKIFVEYRV